MTKNAADETQVKQAGKQERMERRDEVDDIKILLKQPAFRRFIWRLFKFCSVFGSIWHPSALIHHNSGKQDVGHWVMAEITEADQESFITMMKENKEKEELQNDN